MAISNNGSPPLLGKDLTAPGSHPTGAVLIPANFRVGDYRWCPNPMPICEAFTRSAATVRFRSFETFAIGVRAFECRARLRKSAVVHSRRVVVFLAARFNLLAPSP